MRLSIIISFCLLFACSQKTKTKKEEVKQKIHATKVFFKNLNEGDTVASPFQVEMGVSGMKIKPAGELEAGTGHHHIILNKSLDF